MFKDRSSAVQFTLQHPCCIRAIPYENDRKGTKSLTMCLYVHTDDQAILEDVKDDAEKEFSGYKIECVNLQRSPLSKIVTRLPSSKRQNRKELSDLTGKIEENLNVFKNRLNVTAICASYKVVDAIERDIPCVTVFVLGKHRIPAGETDIEKLKEDNSRLFGNAEFDVVEGYYEEYEPTPRSEMAYAFPLRGGVGIGVNGGSGAGTLGGFLEDEEGECYILSNEHVLNPPKLKVTDTNDDSTKDVVHGAGASGVLSKDVEASTNDVEMENRTDEVVLGAGISVGLVEDVEGKSRSRSVNVPPPFEVGNNTSDVGMNNSTGKIIEQPAQTDYNTMVKDAKQDLDETLDELRNENTQVAELPQAEIDELKKNDNDFKRMLDRLERKKTKAEQEFEAIKDDEPRQIGTYVDGLKENVEVTLDDKSCKIFVDVAIAKLHKGELECIRKGKDKSNRCPLYGFKKIKDIIPNGETVDLETFFKEIHPNSEPEKKLSFLKIGRGTGLTYEGRIDTLDNCVERVFVNGLSHVPFRYCEKCKPSDISETELVSHEYDGPQRCVKCNVKLEKCEVSAFWKHNCLVIQKRGKPFCEEGDSGSIIFDNRGRALGLMHGVFHCNDINFCLASPLSVALEALGKKCGKKLKLW